ncbi:argininosuccinate lyase [Thermoflavifilum thermophilum]|uniref:Argininosuccinate lyase n=1 Tax=Thermoflavifilum thermophilum TaxID=1393122 RepID=A0A1I7N0I4_9BACT|nr:argininosuccinate lyase [Thermoflavifilum thermophilum]SFV28161.1 argininosuccinate lyase [Thermoflavifilum thermophilum]
MNKLWQKNIPVHEAVERFTTASDRQFDPLLAPFDILGSLAHIRMLAAVGLLAETEQKQLATALREIYQRIAEKGFALEPGVEDVHSQIELWLTQKLGDIGKKIHSGRSRNDQVLVDIKLFLRAEIESLVQALHRFFQKLMQLSEQHRNDLMPGYTHLQLAMPSSFGLWFGAYAESLVDDMRILRAAFDVVNKNPLGSAAGYGSSFPLNRKMTTTLLGFDDLHYNVVYAQMSRGKTEKIVAQALSNIAATLGRMAMDVCLYMNPHFNFIRLPDEFTTGSSIMPHKKNPDVFELIRARCNQLQALPYEITLMTTNLPSGYHRDLQLIKEHLFPAFQLLKDCIQMSDLMFSHLEVRKNILDDPQYKYLFSVEEVNRRVLQGIPFRDAYRQVAKEIEEGRFQYSGELHHTHEGSIGNLCLDDINRMMETQVNSFPFEKIHRALDQLLAEA